MFQDYFEIQSIGPTEDIHFILSKVFTRLHGVLKSGALNIGLGFPELSEHSPGSIVRCFGTPKNLEELRCNNGLVQLEMRRMIEIGTTATVPSDATAIAYRRDRNAEKHVAGFRQRQMRRRIRRSGNTDMKHKVISDSISEREKKNEVKRLAYVLIERNGQRLPIHLSTSRLGINPDICQFNTYGLASKVDGKYSAVPKF